MRLSSKTFRTAAIILLGGVSAGIFVWAFSVDHRTNLVRVSDNVAAPGQDPLRVVQILEEQLAFATAELERLPAGQRASSFELIGNLTQRLRVARADAIRVVRILEQQLAFATAEAEQVSESRRAASQELIRELTERLRVARISAGV